MAAFLQQLFITLAIFASCGLSGLARGAPRWVLGAAAGLPRPALVHGFDLFGKATRPGGAARPTRRAEAPSGPKLMGPGGDGPDHPCLAQAFSAPSWPAPWGCAPGGRPGEAGRPLKGLQPEQGGMRGPPTARG
ncbi:hypothetical protein [Mesoterricola silvestris]|uniref:Uncharacterized protein n=1 Tax=Mesoterricola silvestris TaxID=2927979 RepID=A0AA48GU78_9BACT|nr:hypothetical protein [Mesoterricola silvestris]BDU74147.1 hypothetical protein METEAL_33210 [Mesoterricola silvestris]